MNKKTLVMVLLSLAVSLGSVYAQNNLSEDILLSDRWGNDELSFDFDADGSVVSYYTVGEKDGALRGEWRQRNDRVIIADISMEGAYPSNFIHGEKLTLHYEYNLRDPKASQMLYADDESQLRVWNKSSFVEEGTSIALTDTFREGSIAAVTTGYRLTATTVNLRLRQGPGIDYESQIYTYFDRDSQTVKTYTSVWAGTNLRILARTSEKMQVLKWYNHWYYVEYKEPVGDMIVYRNAWMFGEFLNVTENKDRWVHIGSPENEQALYNDYEVRVRGTTAGSPIGMYVQVKNSLGTIVRETRIYDYNQVEGTFIHELSKRDESLFIGSNTINVIAEYSDFSKVNRQITFYIHESVGEMAKPVIYLYPPQEMDIRVEVDPLSGFSFTEPAYNGGWDVSATADGIITDKADGKTWPYLFWESNSKTRPNTNEGFVVKRDELGIFFSEKLSFLGLNYQEIDDFLEYWIPLLQEGPWYYISFIDQETQDAEAPLSITPKPDSVIRVFFDSMPLEEPISVPEQQLIPRERTGFAVIEWGGMKYQD